jgi:hypothetical protein
MASDFRSSEYDKLGSHLINEITPAAAATEIESPAQVGK